MAGRRVVLLRRKRNSRKKWFHRGLMLAAVFLFIIAILKLSGFKLSTFKLPGFKVLDNTTEYSINLPLESDSGQSTGLTMDNTEESSSLTSSAQSSESSEGDKSSFPNPMVLVETEALKGALDMELPMIGATYNNGNVSITFGSEVKKLLKTLFGFDPDNPVTILNLQSPIFRNYYSNSLNNPYAKNDDLAKLDYSSPDTGISDRSDSGRSDGENTGSGQNGLSPTPAPLYEEPEVLTGNKLIFHNETKFRITDGEIQTLLKANLSLKAKKKGPQVLIVHTHTKEAYLKNLDELNKGGLDPYSSDPSKTVVRVGEELAQNLRKEYGIEVIHNGTVHDGEFNSAYARSMETISSILKSYPSIRMVIDLHRDALGNDRKLRTAIKKDGKSVSRVMFVVGTNEVYKHPTWRENFKLALKLHTRINELASGIARPMNISYNRYNQHLSNGSMIIEVGGDGDTLEEAMESTGYLATVISELLK